MLSWQQACLDAQRETIEAMRERNRAQIRVSELEEELRGHRAAATQAASAADGPIFTLHSGPEWESLKASTLAIRERDRASAAADSAPQPRQARLIEAVAAAAKELRWGADMANTLVKNRLNGVASELEEALAALGELPPAGTREPQWRRTSEELPQEGDPCIVFDEDNYGIAELVKSSTGQFTWSSGHDWAVPVAECPLWIPLPPLAESQRLWLSVRPPDAAGAGERAE